MALHTNPEYTVTSAKNPSENRCEVSHLTSHKVILSFIAHTYCKFHLPTCVNCYRKYY